ncbi:YhhN family protein [Ferrimonas balearica DSM 9799]|uniref:YhhN family protein n=1 Tax=Ferrimonas balearica (strain DSM 9799 / CCM 4581 / KCTC 23876 / PAT) TaxID=550540 RepID=E1SML1_FERBD|nr:lysoplasmalogenase [Ferrimonas balearica]ADN75550.1 YhhN family protein [Ferrimonas balearica DSM 9799]
MNTLTRTSAPAGLALIFWGCALAYTLTESLRPYPASDLLKSIPALSLALFSYLTLQGRERALLVMALCFAAFGDTILDRGHDSHLLPGLMAFGVTQSALILLFWRRPKGPYAHLAWGLPIGTLVFLYLITPFLADTPQGDLRAAIALYSGLLTFMVMGCCWSAQHWRPVVGAFLFLISDSLIAIDTFIWPSAAGLPAIFLTYFAALWLLFGPPARG